MTDPSDEFAPTCVLCDQHVTPDVVTEIIEQHLIGGKPVERLINPEMKVTG